MKNTDPGTFPFHSISVSMPNECNLVYRWSLNKGNNFIHGVKRFVFELQGSFLLLSMGCLLSTHEQARVVAVRDGDVAAVSLS